MGRGGKVFAKGISDKGFFSDYIVLDFMLKSMIYFKIILEYGMRCGLRFFAHRCPTGPASFFNLICINFFLKKSCIHISKAREG